MLERHFVLTTVLRYKFVCLVIILLVLTTISLFALAKRNISSVRGTEPSGPAKAHSTSGSASATDQVSSTLQQNCNFDKAETDQNRVAIFNGTSFTYDLSIALQLKMETVSASPLDSESDKPDMVTPEHIAFTFIGPYALRHESSFFSPQVHIYPIAGYKNVLSKSASYTQQLENEIWSLRTLLAERPAAIEKEIPFLPFGIDATQSFRARINYIDFKNGKGIMFLTQYNIEPSLINNYGLVYTFQGLTNDNLYYVSATFPVTASILPEGRKTDSRAGYTLPAYFYDRDYKLNEQSYQKYLASIKDKLEKLPANKYQPNLTLFESLVRSLCVTPIKAS